MRLLWRDIITLVFFGWHKRLNNIQMNPVRILNTEMSLTPVLRTQFKYDIKRLRFSECERGACVVYFQTENCPFTKKLFLKYWWLSGLVWEQKTDLNARLRNQMNVPIT